MMWIQKSHSYVKPEHKRKGLKGEIENMKILIAVPTYENISPDTFKSIYGLNKGEHECYFDFIRGYDCATARNRIAQLALDMNVDYVLMVDNDVVLPSDALLNLLENKPDVCLGYYMHRNAHNTQSNKSVMFRMGEFNFSIQIPMSELKDLANRKEYRVEVHGGGLGCALISAETLRKIESPWFKWVIYPNGDVLSEDLYFCTQCAKSQIKIYTDTRVGCGHLMRQVHW